MKKTQTINEFCKQSLIMESKKQSDWYIDNFPVGIYLGYPECCIEEFCLQSPEDMKNAAPTKDDQRRFEAAQLNGEFTGFIPCLNHANKILQGEIKLIDLIGERDTKLSPFPNA